MYSQWVQVLFYTFPNGRCKRLESNRKSHWSSLTWEKKGQVRRYNLIVHFGRILEFGGGSTCFIFLIELSWPWNNDLKHIEVFQNARQIKGHLRSFLASLDLCSFSIHANCGQGPQQDVTIHLWASFQGQPTAYLEIQEPQAGQKTCSLPCNLIFRSKFEKPFTKHPGHWKHANSITKNSKLGFTPTLLFNVLHL